MKKKSRWGYGIAGVYTLFAVATIGFVIFSRFHQMDLVTKHYYQEELHYQNQIERNERTLALPHPFDWEYDAAARSVILKFPVEMAKDVSGTILFFRPSDAAQDQVVPIKLSDQGRQIIDASSLSKGMWRLKVFWKTEKDDYYNEDILVID